MYIHVIIRSYFSSSNVVHVAVLSSWTDTGETADTGDMTDTGDTADTGSSSDVSASRMYIHLLVLRT